MSQMLVVTKVSKLYLITKNRETFLQTKLEPVATCHSDIIIK